MFILRPPAPSTDRLLATLREHKNAVTDMKYSNAGNRILTASMKDGVVCLWSLGKEGVATSVSPATAHVDSGPRYAKFSHISQLVIQLSHPSHLKGTTTHCDGVTWTCDDTKVVTSQSSPLKASGTDIIPESHSELLFMHLVHL